MKRSEMVKILEDSFNKRSKDPDTIEAGNLYSLVLMDLEDAGMSPPERIYWNSKNSNDVNENGIPKDLQYSSWNGEKVNWWEEE